MTKQKKPKVGDTVGWIVVDSFGDIFDVASMRSEARETANTANKNGPYKPYRIAKIVLSK